MEFRAFLGTKNDPKIDHFGTTFGQGSRTTSGGVAARGGRQDSGPHSVNGRGRAEQQGEEGGRKGRGTGTEEVRKKGKAPPQHPPQVSAASCAVNKQRGATSACCLRSLLRFLEGESEGEDLPLSLLFRPLSLFCRLPLVCPTPCPCLVPPAYRLRTKVAERVFGCCVENVDYAISRLSREPQNRHFDENSQKTPFFGLCVHLFFGHLSNRPKIH